MSTMSTSNSKSSSGVTRDEVASLLQVTTKTVDRYIRSGKLKSTKKANRVFITRDSVQAFLQKNPEFNEIEVDRSEHPNVHYVHSDKPQTKELSGGEVDREVDKVDTSGQVSTSPSTDSVYQHLYEEVKTKIDGYQKRLEAANYRVGELEGQLKNSVPLLEHAKTEQAVQALNTKFSIERYNKTIFVYLLFIMIVFSLIQAIIILTT